MWFMLEKYKTSLEFGNELCKLYVNLQFEFCFFDRVVIIPVGSQ